MIKDHPSYKYSCGVLQGKIKAPKYVILQCAAFVYIADGKSEKYYIDEDKIKAIDNVLKLMIMPKGLKARKTVFECTAGFQWLFYIATLCTVYREDKEHRRYETVILEICRKNGKTFLIAILFILLFLLEPKFAKFYSVAPDGSLSREVKSSIEEIIKSSTALSATYQGKQQFKMLRDYIYCSITESKYTPLNYSNSNLDGKLPNVFLADEVGGLPNPYAIEAMRSGQLTILNKLGCIISTKYPTFNNPFEDEVKHAKEVLDKVSDDETLFALLYEPDNTLDWATDDEILEQANPLALEIPEIMEDLKKKRQLAIEIESKRENFVTKHCNIIYQGVGTESYVSVTDVQKGKVNKIDWSGREVYLGVDLALTNDNCSVAMVAYDDETGDILGDAIAFIPEDRIDEKNKFEKIDYRVYIEDKTCIACGNKTVAYDVIEDYVFQIEEKYSVKIMGIYFDRANALSSAQKWDKIYNTIQVRQHSDTLHMPTKLLAEKIADGKFHYTENELLEINFQNAKCRYDDTLRRYVSKKRSSGKVDMVIALINAVFGLQQNQLINTQEIFVDSF